MQTIYQAGGALAWGTECEVQVAGYPAETVDNTTSQHLKQ